MGNQHGKHQNSLTNNGKPKKFVHWKSAERPSPPGRPILIPLSDQQPDVITLKWQRPQSDGGAAILGYIVEHRRMGSPHWVRATPSLVTGCECSIGGLEPGWRYQFRSIAENVVGKSDPSELSDALTVTLQRNAISVPRFVNELLDTNVVENDRVELRVTVVGQPPPEISWFKDGFEIFSSRRTKIVHDNDVSVLIIHQVALTDEGEIKCTATNRAGHVVTRAKLKVEAPPKIRLPRNYEDGLIVEADELLRLKVGIAGQPIPQVLWSHEGSAIRNGGRYELVTTDKNSSLKIDNVKRGDRGEYHIKAINHLGEDVASFLVTVTARPNPPGKVQLNMSFGKSATLSWTAPTDDGGCKIGNYIVEYFRIGWNVWLKASTTRQLSATLHDLIEGSEYKFRVKAENPYGLSDPSEESDVLFIPDPKRGINKPEEKDVPPDMKPVPPKRKTLSPIGKHLFPDKNESSSREVSPNRQSPSKNIKPTLFESEQLNREMAYGMSDDVVNKSITKSGSGSKLETDEPKNKLDVGENSSAPTIVRKNSLRLEVTEKIQQFFKRSPSPSRKSSKSPKEQSPKEGSPNKPTSQKDLMTIKTTEERFNVTQTDQQGKIMEKQLSPSIERKIQERLRLEEQKDVMQELSPSPLINRKMSAPASLMDNRKSPALQRSEEPTNIEEAQAIEQYFGKRITATNDNPNKANGDIISNKQHASTLTNPTIEISAPTNEPHVLSHSEKRDEVHTSNEFMLVLYPDKKPKEKNNRESFDLDLEDALSPPPISLSVPDFSSAEQYFMPIQIRRSVSSTELLYEKAMARFYEAVEIEESGRTKKFKLSQEQSIGQPKIRKRLGSMSEAERLSFERRSMRRKSTDITQELIKLPNKWDSKENLSQFKPTIKKVDELYSETIIEDLNIEEGKETVSISAEYLSDYTESTASEGSMESMEKFKMDLMAISKPISDELETYHPRRMSEGSFSPYRSPTPDQSSIVLTKPHPLPSPDFVPKPILKRPSNEDVVTDDLKFLIQINDQNEKDLSKPDKQEKKEKEKGKGFKAFFRRDKPDSEKMAELENQKKEEASIIQKDIEKKKIAALEVEKKKLETQKSAEEEARVVADHYGEIVKDVFQTRGPSTPIYLRKNYLQAETDEDENLKISKEDISFTEADLIARAIAKPRMSIVERLQTQHVQTRSKSALEKPKELKAENVAMKEMIADDENGALEKKREEHKPGKAVKTKKIIIRKRVSSGTRSRDTSSTRPTELHESEKRTDNEAPGSRSSSTVRKRQISKTRMRNESQSPLAIRKKPLNLIKPPSDPEINEPNKYEFSEPKHIKSLEEINDEAQENVRSAVSYTTDVGLFVVACWVYIFKDVRLVLPILALMMYRQMGEAISNRIPSWMKKKDS